MARQRRPTATVTSRQAAEGSTGSRPHKRRIAAPDGPFGSTLLNEPVNETITGMLGRLWAIEDDCISFTEGVLIWDETRTSETARRHGAVGYYRVIDWDGVVYRGAHHPLTALKAFDAGLRRHA